MKSKKKDHRVFRQHFAKSLQFVGKRPENIPPFQETPESIVILARECYGDCILLTPLIGTLRREFPELAIHVIAFSQIIFNFFSADKNVTAVYHAKRNMPRYYKGILSKKFDLLFNPKDHPSFHFLIQSVLVRARSKVSHFSPSHEGLFDHLISMEPNTHESLKNLALLNFLGTKTLKPPCRPYLPVMPVSHETEAFLKSLEPGKYIGINISAGHIGGHRTLQQWSELVQAFPDEQFIIFSTPQDLEEKRALEKPHTNIIESPSTRNIYEVGEIVRKLRLLITPDTSLVHIAACSDTPLIALYREYLADRTQFGPLSTIQKVIISQTPDIIDIDPAELSSALREMLKKLS
ncbi:glycosyltransferase family 9 protein [Chlorobium ferrooxidans]|uniref:Glycosyl transferase, family 9 n=1 Tax=Chlorobium ferrooxidans DSM 13031 TaxID=377431 RepID=Q0YSI7_9CHLB|nr:glycosyltransferase family 9 protein [Chlorobium ferrooxidans]EAT59212.1 Glycosyl transferase, family 9 [Chlorobium ferrooxidans DSM 13031]